MEEIIKKFNHEYSRQNTGKIKGSTFLLTINANQKESEKNRKTLEELIDNLFSEKNFPKFLCKYNPKTRQRTPLPMNELVSTKIKSAIEIGDKVEEIHIHALIVVKHKSNVQINLPLLKKIVYKVGTHQLYEGDEKKKIYVNVKGLANAQINFEEYIMKSHK